MKHGDKVWVDEELDGLPGLHAMVYKGGNWFQRDDEHPDAKLLPHYEYELPVDAKVVSR